MNRTAALGQLGLVCLSGCLYCNMSLCYGHLAFSVAWRRKLFCFFVSFLSPCRWEFTVPPEQWASRTGLLFPAAPAALIPVHSHLWNSWVLAPPTPQYPFSTAPHHPQSKQVSTLHLDLRSKPHFWNCTWCPETCTCWHLSSPESGTSKITLLILYWRWQSSGVHI